MFIWQKPVLKIPRPLVRMYRRCSRDTTKKFFATGNETQSHSRSRRVSFRSRLRCYFPFCTLPPVGPGGVAASIAVGIEVYFLSSSIGEMLGGPRITHLVKMFSSIALAAGIVIFFLISKYLHA